MKKAKYMAAQLAFALKQGESEDEHVSSGACPENGHFSADLLYLKEEVWWRRRIGTSQAEAV